MDKLQLALAKRGVLEYRRHNLFEEFSLFLNFQISK